MKTDIGDTACPDKHACHLEVMSDLKQRVNTNLDAIQGSVLSVFLSLSDPTKKIGTD